MLLQAVNNGLNKWVYRQREQYKQSKLSNERINRLNEIGFDWEDKYPKEDNDINSEEGKSTKLHKHGNRWNMMYGELKEYKEEVNTEAIMIGLC